MQYFGRADELVALGLVDCSIGTYPQRVFFCLDELDVTEAGETALETKLLCHWEANVELTLVASEKRASDKQPSLA